MTHHAPAEFVAAVDEQLARAGFGPSDTYRPAPLVFADRHVVDVAAAERETCAECGGPCVRDDSPGVWHHQADDSPTGVDHDADAHHVPVLVHA